MFPVHATAKVVRSVLYVSVVTLSSGVTPAFANAWQLETSYGAQLGFDDNFKLNNVDEDKLEVTSLKASVGLSAVRLSPAIQSSAGIRLDAFSFDDNQSELDDRVDITLRYDTRHVQPRYEWRLQATYRDDSLLQDISLDAGTLVLPEDVESGLSREDVRRGRLSIAPSYLYQLSPVSRVRVSGDISSVEHDNVEFQRGSFIVTTNLVDFVSTGINAQYERDLNPINSWWTDLELQDYNSDSSEFSYQTQLLGAGFRHRFSETSDIAFRAAFRNTDFDSDAQSGSDDGVLAQIEANRSTGRTTYAGRVGRTLFPSGSGDVVLADELILNAVHQYSELVTLTWRNKLFQNKALRDNANADRRFLALEPSVNWRFKRWWVLDAGLRYRREKRDNVATSGVSTAGFVGVTYSRPLQGGR